MDGVGYTTWAMLIIQVMLAMLAIFLLCLSRYYRPRTAKLYHNTISL